MVFQVPSVAPLVGVILHLKDGKKHSSFTEDLSLLCLVLCDSNATTKDPAKVQLLGCILHVLFVLHRRMALLGMLLGTPIGNRMVRWKVRIGPQPPDPTPPTNPITPRHGDIWVPNIFCPSSIYVHTHWYMYIMWTMKGIELNQDLVTWGIGRRRPTRL